MKALIAITCVAILGAVAYYGVGEYREHAARQERAESLARAKAELWEVAKAEEGYAGEPKVREYCATIEGIESLKDNFVAQGYIHNCRIFGYL